MFEMWEGRIADIVDIAIVTTLLYAVIVLIRKTQAGFVAIGLLILGALYVAAQALDLRLTAWLLQGFFAVFLIILVVIFQEELRQLFERIALWGLRRSNKRPPEFGITDLVIKCAADFANDRVGALIVFPGQQPVHRHIQGGIELNGKLSEPLLKSIFDASSPGHDGAVVIEQDRVWRFAVHLPLSSDFQQLARVGTRHTAALGLAELTDALCVVVSEERGEISVAQRGKLRTLRSSQELGKVLHDFVNATHPPRKEKRVWLQLVRENWAEKLASLALVVGLWYLFVPGSRPVSFTYELPVRVTNVPAEFVLESVEPSEVTAEFTGLRRAFYLFDPQNMEVTVDASLAKLGRRTFQISNADVTYPSELMLQAVEPDQVKISLEAAPHKPVESR